MLSFVVPMYNEESVIGDTCAALLKKAVDFPGGLEIIVVDDGSTDSSAKIAKSFGDMGVRVIKLLENRGKGAAVKAGVMAAGGELIAYMDSDLAYGLDVVSRAVSLLEQTGADVVAGTRRGQRGSLKAYSPLRRAASDGFSLLLRLTLRFPFSDSQCGFKLYRREAARKIFSLCKTDGYSFDFEALMLADKLGLKVEELPVVIITHKSSKINVFRDSVRIYRDAAAVKRRLDREFKNGQRG